MTRKIERVFRDFRLTTEQVAQDEEVRRKVEAEFPLRPAGERVPGALTHALRSAILASQKTQDQIAQDAGVPTVVVSKFLSGERDIHMATADKLAAALGLRLALADK